VTAVDVRHVSVTIGRAHILHDVSFAAPRGEWLALIGPNGAGKTTLLRAIAGLAQIDSGTIVLDGVPADEMSVRSRARAVAIVPQRPVLPPAMTVFDYVLLGRTPYIRYFDVETASDVAAAGEALRRLDIEDFAERPLGSLSGGEQQRVVLARAIAQSAPVLLLDEGTSALDIGSQQQVLELVESLRVSEGLTVISAMHDLTLAGQFAHTLALLSHGRVISEGEPTVVLQEDLIRETYGAEVRIRHEEDGIVVSPVRAKKATR
jgi:iron complex transport system ATP-binding protein